MARRSLADVLWYALQCAREERSSLVNAYSGDETQEAVRIALNDIELFKKAQMRLFGSCESRNDEMIKALGPVTAVSLIKMMAAGDNFAEEDPAKHDTRKVK